MHTQPERHDHSDQPWLGLPLQPHAALTALGLGLPPTIQDQPSVPARRAPSSSAQLQLRPRHALCSGALCAAEAALRGDAADDAHADPATDLRLGSWLLESACHEAQDWNAVQDLPRTAPGTALRFSPELLLSVDLQACLLRKDGLVLQTKQALSRSGLLPTLLEIQLPAHAILDGESDMLLSLAALRDLGVGLGLDRFGTLPASPAMLQRLPLTAVKLDPALTRDIIHARTTRATVKAAIALAHALGATVLATEVENPTQRDILADLGCDTAQGPIFGGAQPPDVFHASLLGPRLQ